MSEVGYVGVASHAYRLLSAVDVDVDDTTSYVRESSYRSRPEGHTSLQNIIRRTSTSSRLYMSHQVYSCVLLYVLLSLSLCLSVCVSVCLSICLSVCEHNCACHVKTWRHCTYAYSLHVTTSELKADTFPTKNLHVATADRLPTYIMQKAKTQLQSYLMASNCNVKFGIYSSEAARRNVSSRILPNYSNWFEITPNDVTLKSGSGIIQGNWKCHHSFGRLYRLRLPVSTVLPFTIFEAFDAEEYRDLEI